VFGVATTDGVAADVAGIELSDADKEKLRLGDLIRSGIEPRLGHFDIVWLPIKATTGILIVRVPRSWTAPHRVTLLGHDKFYVRNSAGKHPMNVDELRQAFTLSQTIVDRVRAFRFERVGVIIGDEAPFELKAGAKLVFHGVPLGAFVDPPSLSFDYHATQFFPPLGASGHSHQHTLEGLAAHTPRQADGVRAYTMAFRNGIIEGVAHLSADWESGGETQISLARVERYIREGWASLLRFSQHFAIEPPFYILISILNVRGFVPHIPQNWMDEATGSPYRREHLLLPELEIASDRLGETDTVLLKGLFDQIANAFGLHGSLNYSRDGRYLLRR